MLPTFLYQFTTLKCVWTDEGNKKGFKMAIWNFLLSTFMQSSVYENFIWTDDLGFIWPLIHPMKICEIPNIILWAKPKTFKYFFSLCKGCSACSSIQLSFPTSNVPNCFSQIVFSHYSLLRTIYVVDIINYLLTQTLECTFPQIPREQP